MFGAQLEMKMEKLIGARCWIAENVRHPGMRGMAGRVVGVVDYDNSLLVETDDDIPGDLRGHIGRNEPYGVLWRWIRIGEESKHGPITRLDAHEISLAPNRDS